MRTCLALLRKRLTLSGVRRGKVSDSDVDATAITPHAPAQLILKLQAGISSDRA